MFWPNQGADDRGVHVNLSGIGLTAHAKNTENALRLIKFLLSDDAQQWYAEVNQEYPVIADIPISPALDAIGEFKADSLNLTVLGENNRAAVEIMDKAGWR